MDNFMIEVVVIVVLIIINGFFSCSEFAIVSIRKSRLAQLVEEGDPRAVIVEAFQKDPHRLLAVVQIGVTLVGSFASALGGVVAVENVKPLLLGVSSPLIRDAAEPIAVSLVVLIVSYVSLIIGELVPKTIGLHYAESVAVRVARPIQIMSIVGGMGVSFLTWSSRTVLRLLRIKAEGEGFITREEVQHIVAEGQESGVFTEAEHEYIKNIFDFTHTSVREVMVPRTRMIGIDLDASPVAVLQTILENQYSRYPVYRESIENIEGFIHSKDFLGGVVQQGDSFTVSQIIRPPFYVPEGKKVNDLLEEMQRQRVHMALVVDEYGGISGLVTTEDLLEELVGEIEDEHDIGEPGKVIRLDDGTLEVDALLSLSDLAEELGTAFPEDAQYDTLAGLILDTLGRFPEAGEQVLWQGFRFTCLVVTKTAIQRVRIARVDLEPEN